MERLPPYARAALDALRRTDATSEGITVERARAVLREADVGGTDADAGHAIEVLQRHGHVYEVDGQIHITEPEALDDR
jgi:hypothetical protein